MAVSADRFIHDEPALFKASVKFVQKFSTVPDPVLFVSRKASSENARIAWTLLGTVLFQSISYAEFVKVLQGLFEKFPNEGLWTLPVPRESDVLSVIDSVVPRWSLKEHAAGIFWSVGSFVRNHKDLSAWIASRTPREMWRDLGEIYFMGKSNPRPKACAAIFRLLYGGVTIAKPKEGPLPPLPLTMGARRFLAILGPSKEHVFSELTAKEKQAMATDYFKALSPENPYLAAHSLQFFQENGSEDFICRAQTAQCKQCPLYEFCNYGTR